MNWLIIDEGNNMRNTVKASLSTAALMGALTVCLVGSPAVAAGSLHARQLRCGATITTDTKLFSDLVNCPSNGLVIGADNVTLDLNGHTVDGDGMPLEPCPEGDTCDVGVDNLAGYDGLTIVGGTVRQFGVGVFVAGGAADNRLHRLAVADNTDFGIIAVESTDSEIAHTSMSDNGTSGLMLVDSRNALVAQNTVSGSHGFGIFLAGADDSRIQHNRLDGNDHGIAAFEGSSRNILRHNAVSHSGASAIDIGGDGATANRVEHNRVSDNGDGIVVGDAPDTLISNNLVTGTGLFPFTDGGGFGIILDGTDRTTVDRNTVTGGPGPAIFVTQLEQPTPAEDNVISRNHVTNTLSDGILIVTGATGTWLVRNIASGNGDDGIDVDAPATTLTRNTANRNHDLGIEAVAGVTDGGGNHAAGNGNPAQCTNVTCE